jgi:hypothetical protein
MMKIDGPGGKYVDDPEHHLVKPIAIKCAHPAPRFMSMYVLYCENM